MLEAPQYSLSVTVGSEAVAPPCVKACLLNLVARHFGRLQSRQSSVRSGLGLGDGAGSLNYATHVARSLSHRNSFPAFQQTSNYPQPHNTDTMVEVRGKVAESRVARTDGVVWWGNSNHGSISRRISFRRFNHTSNFMPALGAGAFQTNIPVTLLAAKIGDRHRGTALNTEHVRQDSLARCLRDAAPKHCRTS